jgi:hypothetical protein
LALIKLSTVASAASALEEELERLSEDVWFAAMLVLRLIRAASTLADEEEIESELALITSRAVSTLAEELERVMLDA